MRILSISLGLAAVALVAAQADPLAANGPQSTYEWAGDNDLERTLSLQYEAISEQKFRAALLTSLEVADFHAEGCDSVVSKFGAAIKDALSALSTFTSPIPGVGAIVHVIEGILNHVVDILTGTVVNVSASALQLVIGTIQWALTALLLTNGSSPVQGVSAALDLVVFELKRVVSCEATGTGLVEGTSIGRLEANEALCSYLADLYRSTLEDSIKISPAANLPADASEELKRLMTGSLAVLDLMAKTSIAKTNDALLAIRPIFAADLLADYRSELLRLKPSEDIQSYAHVSLGSIVAFSNSLEACLHVAADPVAALEELNEELTAEAEEDEYEDEDEEDDDEEDEDEEDEDGEDEQ